MRNMDEAQGNAPADLTREPMIEAPMPPGHAEAVAELEALRAIVAGFERLPAEARGRTLRYLADRYGVL